MNTTQSHWRMPVWIALLVVASVVFSLGFACAAPLAAFAAAAAITLPRKEAFWLVGAAWLANQVVGYGLLNYPQTTDSFIWGLSIGVTAILSLGAAQWTLQIMQGKHRFMQPVVIFLAAFAVYEGLLFLAAQTPLSGDGNFTAGIVGQVFLLNALAFAGVLALSQISRNTGFLPIPGPSPAVAK